MRAHAVNDNLQSARAAVRAPSNMTRWRAFAAHLAVSAIVVGIVCALIFLVWYPHPYFQAVGAWNVLRVLIGVDLVLGPLLTLVVYKPGKWGLKFDLAVIAIVQLAALLYGTTVIYTERPYYTVFAVDRFNVIARRDVDPAQLADPELMAEQRIGAKPLRGPLLVVASRPQDPESFNRLIEETLFGGRPDIERRPEFWGRYTDRTAEVLAQARPLAQLKAQRPLAAKNIEQAAAKLERDESTLAFLPVIAKNRDLAMLVDSATGMPLGALDVDPWLRRTAAD
jgi:hypothetical protein